MWEKIKMLFTPFFILFYIFLFIVISNWTEIAKFIKSMLSGHFYGA